MKRTKQNIIYIIGLLIVLFGFFISYSKLQIKRNTLADEDFANVQITKVTCYSSGNKSFIVFVRQGKNHIVRIDDKDCNKYRAGDKIDLLYNEKYDLYFTNDISTWNEEIAMLGFAVFFVIILIYLLFPRLNKPN